MTAPPGVDYHRIVPLPSGIMARIQGAVAMSTSVETQGQSSPPESYQSDLADALLDLDEVFEAAREEGIAEPSKLAFENAKRLLKAMYDLSPRRFDVYPMADGYIAVDGRGGYGRAALLTCGSDGDAVCLVTIDGERRRTHYATTAGLPDDFVRQALRELDDGLSA